MKPTLSYQFDDSISNLFFSYVCGDEQNGRFCKIGVY